MMAWTHAAIGAAVGAHTPSNEAAFTVGVVSHGIADLVPHRDCELPVELPLLGLMMAFIALRHGLRSKQFWGAVGAVSPDIENGLARLGLVSEMIYPTHTGKSWFVGHGRKVKSILPQILLIAVCLFLADRNSSK